MGADRAAFRCLLCIHKGQQIGEIIHYRRDGHLRANRPHTGLLGAALGGHLGAVFRVLSGPVVQVRQNDVVSDRPETAGHVVKFLADAGGVHLQNHHRVGAVALWMHDEGLHRTGTC